MVTELVLVAVGNTTTRLARASMKADASRGEMQPSRVMPNSEAHAIELAVIALADTLEADSSRILVASTNDSVADALISKLREAAARSQAAGAGLARVIRVTADPTQGLAVPMQTALGEAASTKVGVDRLLGALAAFDRTKGQCIVIDAGTAITVNYVDKWGVFGGGLIAPGLRAMLAVMHASTDKLPVVELPTDVAGVPSGPLGKDTREAMLLGAIEAARGLAHRSIDTIALAVGSYPRIIATGGDAALLFSSDELIEHIVPDLVLMGLHAAWSRAEGGEIAGAGARAADGDDEDMAEDESEEEMELDAEDQ